MRARTRCLQVTALCFSASLTLTAGLVWSAEAVPPKVHPPAAGFKSPAVWGETDVVSGIRGAESWNVASADAQMIQDD